jgi:ribonuclease P protein component
MSSSSNSGLRHSLKKTERLKKKKAIEVLYEKGVAFKAPAIIVLAHAEPGSADVKAMFTAPKKKYKRAHDRNRIKRLFREAYRHQKFPIMELASNKQLQISLAFIFTGKTLPNQVYINQKTQILIQDVLQYFQPK